MLKKYYSKCLETFLILPGLAMCYLYDYGVFENFEVTKASFVKEQKIRHKLVHTLANLHTKRDTIIRALHGTIVSATKYNNHLNTNMLTANTYSTLQFNDLFDNIRFGDVGESLVTLNYDSQKQKGDIAPFNFVYNASQKSNLNSFSSLNVRRGMFYIL